MKKTYSTKPESQALFKKSCLSKKSALCLKSPNSVKKGATEKARGSLLWSKMYHYFMFNREEFLNHYHKRGNAETVFHMIKAKFGDYVRSKDKIAQINEVLLKILCHNICVVIQKMHETGLRFEFAKSAHLFPTLHNNSAIPQQSP